MEEKLPCTMSGEGNVKDILLYSNNKPSKERVSQYLYHKWLSLITPRPVHISSCDTWLMAPSVLLMVSGRQFSREMDRQGHILSQKFGCMSYVTTGDCFGKISTSHKGPSFPLTGPFSHFPSNLHGHPHPWPEGPLLLKPMPRRRWGRHSLPRLSPAQWLSPLGCTFCVLWRICSLGCHQDSGHLE